MEEATGKKESFSFSQLPQAGALSKAEIWQLDHFPVVGVLATNDWNKKQLHLENLPHYQAERQRAYRNMEKFLPFYNKELLIKYGNAIHTHTKLLTTDLVSVTPMNGMTIVVQENQPMDRLLLHYADGSSECLTLGDRMVNPETQFVEYTVAEDGLLYTPNQFLQDYSQVIAQIMPHIKATNLHSDKMKQTLGIAAGTESEETLKELYFEEAFDDVKEHFEEYITAILTGSAVASVKQSAITTDLVTYVKDHKNELLLGMTYINQLYDLSFGDVAFKKIALARLSEFYGQYKSPLEFLVTLGASGYDHLLIKNNVATYQTFFQSETKQADITDFLNYNRTLLTAWDEQTWFKEATKEHVIIKEVASKEAPQAEYRVYPRLVSNEEYKKYLLPLLSLKKAQLFITSNFSTMTFSMRERHEELDEATYRQRIDLLAKRQAKHMDLWYRLLPKAFQDRLIKPINPPITWGGYVVPNSGLKWFSKFGENPQDSSKPALSLREFFGPIGKFFKPNGAQAYANGRMVHMVVGDILSEYDLSTWTHEMVHNYDRDIYFHGYGRREHMGAEEYAKGMWQSQWRANQDEFGINSAYEWQDEKDRLNNASPDRFQSIADLNEYLSNQLEVIYLLDYLEGMAVIDQGKAVQKQWFNQLDHTLDPVRNQPMFVNHLDRIHPFTDEEWETLKLTSIEDLIRHQVIVKRYYGNNEKNELIGRNVYNSVSMFAPIFASGENATGSPGGLIFKRMAFELLGNQGYEAGFLPYITNQYYQESMAKNQNLNDNYIIEKVTNGKYHSLTDYKVAMYQQRAKQFLTASFKPITVVVDRKAYTITHYNDLKTLMDQLVAEDVANQTIINRSKVQALKVAVLQEWLKATNDFRTTIYQLS